MRSALALACAGGLAAAALASAPAMAGTTPQAGGDLARAGGFVGARGFDIGKSGKTVISSADGVVTRVFRTGDKAGQRTRVARVPANYVAPSVAVADDNAVWILTAGGDAPTPGLGTLFLKQNGKPKRAVVNIQKWVSQAKKGADPYDLEKNKRESNPYGVAAMPDGSALVADAANNAVFRVTRAGKVQVVARVKPRVVDVPAPFQSPGAPTKMPAEAVTTAVTVAPDGGIYIGELRGFPATVGSSQIWRVKPGARDAVCDPAAPNRGSCRRIVDGLTSVVSLDTGRGGAIYAAELSKMSWIMMEGDGQNPPPAGSEIGAVIRIGHDRSVRRELSPGKVIMPGSVAVGGNGNVFVSGPVFGPGGFMRVG